MIDWRRGGWTGSLNLWVRREVREQFHGSVAARRARYSYAHRALRRAFSVGTFGRFVGFYFIINLVFVAAEALSAWFVPDWLPSWTTSGAVPATDIKALLLNISSYLIGVQVGMLGVISLALALVTLIGERDGSSTDVQIYYHESLSFELVASCVALTAVLCVQLLWPLQFFMHRFGFGTDLQVFKLGLLGLHLVWLLLNLGAVASFIATTFRFVQQSARELLRERYTANLVQPRDMTVRLRQQLYQAAGMELLGEDGDKKEEPRRPNATFGFDYGEPRTVEIEASFARPAELHDVRIIWVRWVLRRWSARCLLAGAKQSERGLHGLGHQGPLLWFTPNMDHPMNGRVGWCRRRGGLPLTAVEKFVLRHAFRFRRTTMRHDLPTPGDILEELAEKTATQIDRLASVAFDRSLREMTRYHRFLLALNASRTPDGLPFNFAEVAGVAWKAPHRDWIGQYRQLFERAANRLSDDNHFILSLAYAASRLLPDPGEPELSTNIVKDILNLERMMIHQLEGWVTKRTTIAVRVGESAEPRLALAGSDARAYANTLPGIVGAWESLLEDASSIYGWRERGKQTDVERWSAFRASWPFLWQHLSNTAHSLAVAVWNEDEPGAAMFREALVRWPEALGHWDNDRAGLRQCRLLFPDILNLDWATASARTALLGYDCMPAPTPDQLFAIALRGAHNDVLLLTAALLLFWTINEKQASDIGGRTARSLLRKEGASEDRLGPEGQELSLRSLFLDLLRLQMAGGRFRDGSYADELDRLIGGLDDMTERRVVPGRVFTPSTLHEKDDLLVPVVAILTAATPDDGDEGLRERIAGLAREEDVLPEGDLTLRNVVHELGRLHSVIDEALPQVPRGAAILAPRRDADRLAGRLREIITSAKTTIEARRLERLRARPVDPVRLERIRLAIEDGLLNQPASTPFFNGVQVGHDTHGAAAESQEVTFRGLSKAQLIEPPMEAPTSGFDEMLVAGSREWIGKLVWADFRRRVPNPETVSLRPIEEAFWRVIAPLVCQVGPNPVLVVSRNVEGLALRQFLYAAPADRPNLTVERRSSTWNDGSYIITIEGVDVHGADSPPGVAWLFSANALRSVRYVELDQSARYVNVTFEPTEDTKGSLRVRVRQRLEWADTPTFELRGPGSDEPDAAPRD